MLRYQRALAPYKSCDRATTVPRQDFYENAPYIRAIISSTYISAIERLLVHTTVKREMDAAVHLPKFYNGINPSLTCTSCSKFVAILRKTVVLYDWRFNNRLYCTFVLRKLQVRNETILLKHLLLC